MTAFSHRWATASDIPAITALMARAIEELQRGFLSAEQIAASKAIMGLDTQLVVDGTYVLIEAGERLAGCGGWSRRATLYGGNHSTGLRDARLLDPATEPARIRAMFTDPGFARRGVGRLVLQLCEAAAREAGFAQAELMGTMAGVPLYRACGYEAVEDVASEIDGVAVPLTRMTKRLN